MMQIIRFRVDGCLKMQNYNEKKGRLLNCFHIVKVLEKSTEATRSIQMHHGH